MIIIFLETVLGPQCFVRESHDLTSSPLTPNMEKNLVAIEKSKE